MDAPASPKVRVEVDLFSTRTRSRIAPQFHRVCSDGEHGETATQHRHQDGREQQRCYWMPGDHQAQLGEHLGRRDKKNETDRDETGLFECV